MHSGSNIGDVHSRIIRTIRDFFAQAGMSRAVLGLSGGLDSAVVAALAVEALGKDNVTGILMPSSWSTVHSVNDAVTLADNLGIKYHIVPISAVYDRFMKETEPLFEGDFHWDITQENLQARIRSTILMIYSNRHRALLLNTTNKSELSMGYGTLYGDLCGALMVIADLYKTEVYEMAAWINRNGEVIPSSTIAKAPSAERHRLAPALRYPRPHTLPSQRGRYERGTDFAGRCGQGACGENHPAQKGRGIQGSPAGSHDQGQHRPPPGQEQMGGAGRTII